MENVFWYFEKYVYNKYIRYLHNMVQYYITHKVHYIRFIKKNQTLKYTV